MITVEHIGDIFICLFVVKEHGTKNCVLQSTCRLSKIKLS